MGGYKITGLAAATSTGDALAYGRAATVTDLTTTGNTILGDASTDTLNVGNGGLIKDASGNVGVGVTPSAWTTYKALQIGPFAAFADSTSGNIDLSSNRYNASGDKYIGSGYASMLRQSDGAFKFFTAASGTAGNTITFTQAMTLDASGNLLVGTTTNTGSGATSGKMVSSFNGAVANGLYCDDTRTSAGTDNALIFGRGATVVGSVSTTLSTTSYNPSSDIRLKENIVAITNGVERVMKLKPVDYNWKLDGVLDNGFIAQDLLQESYFAHRVNPIGKAKDGSDLYGVDYMKFVAVLTAAIQEQQALITQLQADVAALKG
jgi:hypothetical protein